MRKVEIVNRIADEIDITKVKAEEAVDAILDELKDSLCRGESVVSAAFRHLSGARKARASRSQPQNGRGSQNSGAAGGTLQVRQVFQGRHQRRRLMRIPNKTENFDHG